MSCGGFQPGSLAEYYCGNTFVPCQVLYVTVSRKSTVPVQVFDSRQLCLGWQHISSEEFRMMCHCVEFPARILFDSDQRREMGIGLGELVSISKPVTFV
jgi:hypothetical protein